MSSKKSKEFSWVPTPEDYEKIAKKSAIPAVHFLGRTLVSAYTMARYGRPRLFVSQSFLDTDRSDSPSAILAPHRGGFETIASPAVFERAGLHHARPAAKLELFQNLLMRQGMIWLGGFPVARSSLSQDAYFAAQREMHEKGDITWTYGEGKRIHKDVSRVATIKVGAARAVLESDCYIIPVGVAGMSSEKEGDGDDRYVVARDKRSILGLGPRLVYYIGDPFKLARLTTPLDVPRSEMIRDERRLQDNELRKSALVIQDSLQIAHDVAYQLRGSTLEQRFD